MRSIAHRRTRTTFDDRSRLEKRASPIHDALVPKRLGLYLNIAIDALNTSTDVDGDGHALQRDKSGGEPLFDQVLPAIITYQPRREPPHRFLRRPR